MKFLLSICLVLIGFNIFVYNAISAYANSAPYLDLYFLDVGQGDSELAILPGPDGEKIKVLIDGGPGRATLGALSKVIPATDRYIDLIILSHDSLDHFGGLIDILGRYKVGALLWTGRSGTANAWADFERAVKESEVRTIILKEGDNITYKDSRFDVLMPNKAFLNSKEPNDAMLVLRLESEGSRTLFTGDIGYKTMNPEKYLVDEYDIDIDILKVGHHGSKYSSSAEFMAEASPRVSIVEVGKNSYGHPTKEAMARVADIGSSIYRTDLDGTVHIRLKDGIINVYGLKPLLD